MIERSHRTLSNMLRTMLLEKKRREWSSLLPSVMLYMNSMIQKKTGVSACEILFGRSPNLPSDISFTPVTSLSDDREGYVKQLKRDLQDIRQKLSRVLGQNVDQSENPFTVGEKVIIAILPHERANKLMAKWKGPFTVTKIPNRFQIEYLDGSVTRLTHISYLKKYNERCQYTTWVGMPHEKRVSQLEPWGRMALLRLIAGGGRHRRRMVVPSMKAITDKWPIYSGRIRVQVLGKGEPLPSDLQAVVDATGPDSCIEGRVLVDLCKQRSGKSGSGCNAPVEIYKWPASADGSCKSSEGFPTPVTPPLRPPKPARMGRKQYSWRNSSKREVCMHLHILKPLEFRKEKKELTFKRQESTNCREAESTFPGPPDDNGMKDDGMVMSSNSDVTTLWNADVNRLIARKRFVPRKRLLPYSVESFKESLKACSKIITFIALYLAIVTNVLGGLINFKRYERKSTVGTSASLPRSKNSMDDNCHYSLSVLRKFLANILGSNKELWPYVIMYPMWKENKQFKRGKGELQKLRNTLIFRLVTAFSWLNNLRFGNVTRETFRLRSGNVRKTFLAGKCLRAYLCLSADSWASCLYYLSIYTVNLELNNKFKRFGD